VANVQGRCVVSYDPNIRLNVEPELAVWQERFAWMLSRTQLLKISDEDLALLFPGMSIDAFLDKCQQAGVAIAIVTRGGEGAIGRCGAGTVTAKSELPGTLVDTVGAGDTYQAALLTRLSEMGLLDSDSLGTLPLQVLEEIMVFAARAAAITCTRRGADLPRRVEVTTV
jgi:fructokinase